MSKFIFLRGNFVYAAMLSALAMVVLHACSPDVPEPENPYSKVNYGDTTKPAQTPPDPNTIVGIHKNILSVKCANPSCHDGSFEPDYRTVQSAYSTLVYHKVKKNTPDTAFTFRVIPYDTAQSWLHERLVTTDLNLGRMPLYSQPLSAQEMGNINTWIMNGAKDMFGNPAVLPNTKPTIVGYVATDSLYQRIDSIRDGGVFYNSFIVKPGSKFKVIMVVEDDSTQVKDMLVNKLKLSYDKDDFSAAITYNAYFLSIFNFNIWMIDINSSIFPTGSILYMRYYINDGDHTADTEFPVQQSVTPYKTYYSFIVK